MRKCKFSPSKVCGTAEDFADYWHAKAGAGASKRDWFATWRVWCRRERDRSQTTQGTARIRGTYEGKALTSLDDGALDALARELGIARARPGESMQAFIGRIQAAQNGRGSLH